MYAHLPIGLRSVQEALKLLQEWVPGLIEKIPSHVVIAEWCHKAGLETYLEAPSKVGEHYAEIIDESITIGHQKALVQLAVPATAPNQPLRFEDTEVISISVAPSWTGNNVKAELESTWKVVGHRPDYVVSDGGRNLVKGIRDASMPHHLDISHTVGNIIKDIYDEDQEFKAFTTLMEKLRLKVQLTENAFLQPPKQRAIARFMNMQTWVTWADNLIKVYPTLSEEVKSAYAPVLEHKVLIEELEQIMSAVCRMEKLCKGSGLSIAVSNLLQREIAHSFIKPGVPNRVKTVASGLLKYLVAESKMLPDENACHVISSDIIESAFGNFKFKSSHNKNCGVTVHIMMMPLATKLKTEKGREMFDYVKALTSIRRADLDDWCNMKLDENMMSRRRNTFKKAG